MNQEQIVSKTGTRHILAGGSRALCQYTIREDEVLPLSEGTRDCEFCLAELADIEERERKAAERAARAAADAA